MEDQQVPGGPEPPVRRWAHPIRQEPPTLLPESMLHYIHCALSYQNQQLADIKALLQQVAELLSRSGEEK